ncbi:aminoimidazole riboside kinase [Neobacillus piezotolerans]|uniref:Aminoimidazole riboside kinase n=1 Tax=Neobacillus piezotolerans TaxID=2259171 RepID=A0A3D8GTH0_9BACI|nr:aminoimidazole riboside kinase [Neobacillus piezotolerans]RDU37356.1 aminoimidazole riboside kinase [Neobacillus piezotolerans]
MKGVLCLGEALIDFIPLDSENLTYQKAPGGAPANVAVGISKLGGRAAFIGKVGDDVLGHFLKETLEGYGVDASPLVLTKEARTGVTFVTLEPSGERSFSFYIDPSADRFLRKEELAPSLFKTNKIFHFGSISLIGEPSRSATLWAIEKAKEAGMLVSYDPNLRIGLWESEEQARETILSVLPYVDILKVSDVELSFLTGAASLEEGLAKLREVPLTLLTLGGEGSIYSFNGITGKVPALRCKVVDTTGAGDAFVAGILYSINESPKTLTGHSEQEIREMVRFASVSGGLATTKKGAMAGLPNLKELSGYLNTKN